MAIPFRQVFRHASAERDKAAAVRVTAAGLDGAVGYGEGCPREYVTGESLSSATRFIERHRDSVAATVHDLASLKAWMADRRDEIDRNPAAWGALELALLDLLSRQASLPVEAYLGLPRLGSVFAYTAVIGVGSAEQSAATLAQYRTLGMTDFKLKLSGDPAVDGRIIGLLRDAPPRRVRVDANNLWSDLAAARDHLLGLDYPFFAIEEPFQAGRYDLMQALGEAIDARIILDESALGVDQIAPLAANPERWIVNLRVSKMGGLLRSLEVIEACRRHGIAIIVGAQVGETSLLTRAALTAATAAGDLLIAQEGAFGTFLLTADPFEPELRFGAGGQLEIASHGLADRPGFGLRPREP